MQCMRADLAQSHARSAKPRRAGKKQRKYEGKSGSIDDVKVERNAGSTSQSA